MSQLDISDNGIPEITALFHGPSCSKVMVSIG